MRTAVDLAVTADFGVSAVTCSDHHTGWSPPEESGSHRIVLVRRGSFRRRARDGVAELDGTAGYVSVPGEEEQFAHPAGGDLCTAVWVAPELWRSVVGEDRPARSVLYVDAAVELAHRRLLAVGRPLGPARVVDDSETGDPDRGVTGGPAVDVAFGMAEALVHLVATTQDRPLPGARDRAAVSAARAAIVADHPESRGLVPLARLLGVSPYRLSRAFSQDLGVSLTRFRNRVRVGRAMARIQDGETDLAGLAAELGFADQAHLTRTVRTLVGHTPTALRRLLRPT
ncbi:helix-turn-helix domain-containing protein [Saccharothrix variisporea]|uniref:AraC-like DNA-binding protein n=1 Tax=Saccharothrix variisporea TaxID=543527 RepID=A0A495X3Y8_9PSEU|nr:AraC family transcriptional regulator [Saccharothrix variisporea]RKT68971.1 AraC-like DNA-binding protein [Saccharothrix variisporea]